MRYLPFLTGLHSTAPGLISMAKTASREDKLIFQVDDQYDEYISNKKACRSEDIHKYYCEHRLYNKTLSAINRYIANQLLQEHPEYFSLQHINKRYLLNNSKTGEQLTWNEDWTKIYGKNYLSLFDALCCQVQEDVAICQLENEEDWLAAIHLCAPNHWAAVNKVGKSFIATHAPVADMEKTIQQSPKMLASMFKKALSHVLPGVFQLTRGSIIIQSLPEVGTMIIGMEEISRMILRSFLFALKNRIWLAFLKQMPFSLPYELIFMTSIPWRAMKRKCYYRRWKA